jgi:hypothetical protein
MNTDHQVLLRQDFPLLYGFEDFVGFECGGGWYEIIRELSTGLQAIAGTFPDDCVCGHPRHMSPCRGCEENCVRFETSRPRAAQLKEKFGILTLYMTWATEEMHLLISQCSRVSAKVCERCGRPGTTSSSPTGWLRVRCVSCENQDKLRYSVGFFNDDAG